MTNIDNTPRHLGDGVWEGLNDAEKRLLVDPQKKLNDDEVRERIARFEAEHSKQSFDEGEERSKIGSMGRDSAGNFRPLTPGEGMDEHGGIIVLDKAKAEQFAQHARDVSPRDVRQKARRTEAMKELCNVALNRVDPVSASVVYLDLEQCKKLHEEYSKARAEGFQDNELDFLPMSAYAHKIWPDGKKPLRPMLTHEFGTFQMASNPSSELVGKIVCVQDKDLP